MSNFPGHTGQNMHNRDMSFETLRQEIKTDVFDYQILEFYLRDLRKPRDKISALLAEKKIIRIKKGLYVFGEQWRFAPLNLEVIANLIYGPSCISFEYALSSYGMIPERTVVVTSLSLGKTKNFHTPIGNFEYRAIDAMKFKVGIEYRDLGKEGGYFIASREKALADLVYRTTGIRSLNQLRHYLFEEMRIDESIFKELDANKLEEIAKVYNKQSIHLMRKL